jgi:hypothetical protein
MEKMNEVLNNETPDEADEPERVLDEKEPHIDLHGAQPAAVHN